MPGKGVKVAFHRRGTPYFACYYPGTTSKDYDSFRARASAGQWVWAVYWLRVYVPCPLNL